MAKKGEILGRMGDSTYYRTPDGKVVDDQGNEVKGGIAKTLAAEYEAKQQEKAKAQAEAKAAAEEDKRKKAAEKSAEIARKASEKQAAADQKRQEQQAEREAKAQQQQQQAPKQQAPRQQTSAPRAAPLPKQQAPAAAAPTAPTVGQTIGGAFKKVAINAGQAAFNSAFPTLAGAINKPDKIKSDSNTDDINAGGSRQALNRVADEVNTTNMMMQTSIARQEMTNQILTAILNEVQQIKKPSLGSSILDAASDLLGMGGGKGKASAGGKVVPKTSMLGKAGNVMGGVAGRAGGALLGGAFEAYDEYQESGNATRAASAGAGGAIGGGLGAWGGAAAGGAIGALGGPFAPVTVPLGMLIGGIAGGVGGSMLGGKAGKATYDAVAKPSVPPPTATNNGNMSEELQRLLAKDDKDMAEMEAKANAVKTAAGVTGDNTSVQGTLVGGQVVAASGQELTGKDAGPGASADIKDAKAVKAEAKNDMVYNVRSLVFNAENIAFNNKGQQSAATSSSPMADASPASPQAAAGPNKVTPQTAASAAGVNTPQSRISLQSVTTPAGLSTPAASAGPGASADIRNAIATGTASTQPSATGFGTSQIQAARQNAASTPFTAGPQGGPSQGAMAAGAQTASLGNPNDIKTPPNATAVQLASAMVGKSRTQSLDYLKAGGYNNKGEAWCAEFVNSSLKQSGASGSGSAVANSFQSWGTAVEPSKIQAGDVVLQTRGKGPGQTGGHVGIATGVFQHGQVEMIAGNSGGAVKKYFVAANAQLMVRRGGGSQLAGADPKKSDPTVGGTPGSVTPSTGATAAQLSPKESQALQTASLQAGATPTKGAELNQASTKDMADQRSAKTGITVNQNTSSTPTTDNTGGKNDMSNVGIVEPVDAKARLKELFGIMSA